jgi:hypothetical protein
VLEGSYTYNEVMKNKVETKKELVTYEDICEEAFEPTIALMMKKYDVLSMSNVQLGDAYQEVRDAIKDGSKEFNEAYKEVIKNLLKRYKKLGVFDLSTEPETEEEKAKKDEQALKVNNPTVSSDSVDKDIRFI